MSSRRAAASVWMVAASIGAVEALKDQGICRWDYTLRSLQQHFKGNFKSFTQAKNSLVSSKTASFDDGIMGRFENRTKKKTEERMSKVMELNTWGPTTVRF